MKIEENIPLFRFTCFKIGGPARYFVRVGNEKELSDAVNFAHKEDVPFFILSGGTNILVSDDGFNGVVIKTDFNELRFEGNNVYLGAGVQMSRVVHETVKKDLGGFEWAIGIPGTVGGSVRGNAGCFGGDMSDVIKGVYVFDSNSNAKKVFSNAECEFDYRESIFKNHQELIILGADITLTAGTKDGGAELVREYMKRRISEQDIGEKCAGCIFKNPVSRDTKERISAGHLIDTAGLKGKKIGGAMVSKRHANFFINTGGATAADIITLINYVKKEVLRTHGAELHEEIQYLGIHS